MVDCFIFWIDFLHYSKSEHLHPQKNKKRVCPLSWKRLLSECLALNGGGGGC